MNQLLVCPQSGLERGDNKMEKKELKGIPDEDIEKVSGGRRTLRDSEKKDWIRVREKVEEKARSLRMAGRSREASELETAYWNAYDEWVEHIKLASDTDCDYYFSDFFQI